MRKTRAEIELRIASLEARGIRNERLVAKWKRILRKINT